MIEYINKRMIDWAMWAKRRDDGGLGYPNKSNYCQLVAISATASSGPIVQDAPAMEIELIVTRFKNEKKQLYDVAYWVYLAGNLTMNRVAQELGCCRDTAYTRLHALHVAVMDAMHDNDLEAEERCKNNLFLKSA